MMDASANVVETLEQFYMQQGVTDTVGFAAGQLEILRNTNGRSIIVVVVLIGMSLSILLNNYSIMSKKADYHEEQHGLLQDIANTDPLTGVKNKRAYVEHERLINDMISKKKAEPFALVVCDVNGLKHVNDTYGHKAGDEYIRAASDLICELFQHSPVFRMGGDEFTVFLTGRDFENRSEYMKNLHNTSVNNIESGRVVVSGGIADYSGDKDKDIHSVFERADALMYEEKKLLKSLGAKTRS